MLIVAVDMIFRSERDVINVTEEYLPTGSNRPTVGRNLLIPCSCHTKSSMTNTGRRLFDAQNRVIALGFLVIVRLPTLLA